MVDKEPFGRQPKAVCINFTGEAQDVSFWRQHIKRSCEYKGDLVEQWKDGSLTIFPRAVND